MMAPRTPPPNRRKRLRKWTARHAPATVGEWFIFVLLVIFVPLIVFVGILFIVLIVLGLLAGITFLRSHT